MALRGRKNKKGVILNDAKNPKATATNDSKDLKAAAANPAPEAKSDTNDQPKLTPYQGKSQAFGMFRCQKCKRHWTSAYSWANFGQMCNKCKIIVYPFAQFRLESDESKKLNKSDPKKQHPWELCEKCRALGAFCGEEPKKRRCHRRRNRNTAVTVNQA